MYVALIAGDWEILTEHSLLLSSPLPDSLHAGDHRVIQETGDAFVAAGIYSSNQQYPFRVP